jgi:hypothetical protein
LTRPRYFAGANKIHGFPENLYGPAAETKTNKQNKKQISMKKFLSFALAAAFLISAPGIASAKEKKAGTHGKISAVDTTAKTISITHGKSGEAKTFKVTDATTITLDDKPAKLDDIKVDMFAKVTAGDTEDTAATLTVTTKHPEKKKAAQ